MCNPIAISLAMSVAGSAAQAAGQARARKAMEGAREAERIRQAGLQGKSNELFTESLSSSDKGQHDASQAQAEADRKASYDKAAASTPSPVSESTPVSAGDVNSNKIINTENAARSAQAMGMANQQGSAKAALQGFNDVNLSDMLYNNRMLQKQGTIGNFMQGSAGVLPYEIDAASRKGNGLKSLGDILSLGGTAVGLAGGAGMFETDPNSITSSFDIANMDPAKFQSTYSIANPNNPTLGGINRFDLNGTGLGSDFFKTDFLKNYKPRP
jgi:hypothetical protein